MYDRNTRPSWRRDQADADSGSESQPLLSSDASRGSRRSFVGVGGIIFDSETSDFETGRSYADKTAQPLVFANQYQYRNKVPLRSAGSRDGFAVGGAGPGAGTLTIGGLRGGSGGGNGNPGAGAPPYPYRYYTQLPPRELDSTALLSGQKPGANSPVFVPYLPQAGAETARQSSIVTIFAVWNTIMGTSLLAMPWGLERAGLLGGLLLVVGMGALCLYTTFRVLSVHRLHGSSHDASAEVPELCRKLLGRWAELLARVFSLVVLLGAVIVYWILMSNFLFHSIDYLHDEVTGVSPVRLENVSKIFTPVKCHLLTGTGETPLITSPLAGASVAAPGDPATLAEEDTFHQWWNLESTVPIYLVLIMAPLMNFKSATFFTKFNSLGTLSVLYLLIFILVKSSAWGVNLNFHDVLSEHYSPLFKMSFPATSGMLALSYFIHNIIISIMKNNRHQENNGRDLSIAYVLVTVTYSVIGGVFYISFPLVKSCIEDNLLNNFESWDPMTVAARAFLFFQLVTVFPLVAFMLRSQICTMFLGRSWPGRLSVLMINAIFIVVCILFAIYLPRFGTIIRFTGAISGLVYIFLLPVLLHLASLQRQGKLTKLTTSLHMIIPVIGMANLIAQFFVSDD